MTDVSVIVPVYNAEDTLEACVKSLSVQSYLNMEILLIDDGSTDQSWNLCLHLAEEIESVRPFRQENSGEGSARNFGVQAARGKYIMFADNDDILPPDAVKTMVQTIEESGAELAVGDYIRSWDDVQIPRRFFAQYDQLSLADYLIAQARCARPLDFYFLVVWNKIFLRDVILDNQIMMRPRVILNDFGFVLDYLEHVKTIAITHEPVYCYAYRSFSGLQKFKKLDATKKLQQYAWIFARFDSFAKASLTPEEYTVFRRNINHRLFEGGVPNVSVIVPAFNSAATIRACLESILGQSYLNLELIVAGSESEDLTMKIADEFAVKDKRVKVLKLPYNDLIGAKNAALGETKGRYVLFVQPDETLGRNTLKTVSQVAANRDAALVAWNDQSGMISSTGWNSLGSEVFALQCQEGNSAVDCSVGGKLFQRRVIESEELWFNPNESEADLKFCLNYLSHITTVVWNDGGKKSNEEEATGTDACRKNVL